MTTLRDIGLLNLQDDRAGPNMTLEQMIELLNLSGIELPRKGRMSNALYTTMVRNKLNKAVEASRVMNNSQYAQGTNSRTKRETKRMNGASVALLI